MGPQADLVDSLEQGNKEPESVTDGAAEQNSPDQSPDTVIPLTNLESS